MKILLLSHLFPVENDALSGICNLSRAKALRRIGHEIRIVKPVSILPPVRYFFPKINKGGIAEYYKSCNLSNRLLEFDGFRVEMIKWFPLPAKYLWWQQIYTFHLSIGMRIKRILKAFKPDIIICAGVHPEGTYSRFIKKYIQVPVITIAEGSEMLVYPEKYSGIDKIVKAINGSSNTLIFVSSYMKTQIMKKYDFTNYQIIPNGYERTLFPAKEKKGISGNFKIISVGSLDYYKGHDLLLEAVRISKGVELTIIGSGPCYDQYKKIIMENDLSSRVRIIKYVKQSDLSDILSENDLFCLPSRSESFGVAGLEALATGIPVISSKTGEMIKIIKNGINGFLIDEVSAESIAAAISIARQILWNRNEISSSVEKYSWDNWAEEINKVIEKLTG